MFLDIILTIIFSMVLIIGGFSVIIYIFDHIGGVIKYIYKRIEDILYWIEGKL
jgi:hypothetical protein